MTVADIILDYCKEHIAIYRRQIDLLESGRMKTGEMRDSTSWVDTTAQSLEEGKKHLAELERIKAEAEAQKNKL